MRVSPAELQAVRRGGMLTRYALFDRVAFILADLPADGTAGTGLDEPCLLEHHGIVTKGTFTVHHADGRSETFDAGDAFYVPPGPPTHTFSSTPGTVVGGFASISERTDTSEEALRALGLTIVARPALPMPPPARVQLAGDVDPFRRRGAIEVEGSRMGDWLFMHARFGPRSGYTGGWCDLSHWGLVLDGEVVIDFDDRTELAARGDVYYLPPGHRLASPDGASVIDYTPIDELGVGRVSTWRRAAIALVPRLAADPVSEAATEPGPVRRATAMEVPAPRGPLRLRTLGGLA